MTDHSQRDGVTAISNAELDDMIAALRRIYQEALFAQDQSRNGMHTICDQRFGYIVTHARVALRRIGVDPRTGRRKGKQP